jgi:hypothetical protein
VTKLSSFRRSLSGYTALPGRCRPCLRAIAAGHLAYKAGLDDGSTTPQRDQPVQMLVHPRTVRYWVVELSAVPSAWSDERSFLLASLGDEGAREK